MIYFDLALFVGGYVASALTWGPYVQPMWAKIRNKV
jgi:hypothetical protein